MFCSNCGSNSIQEKKPDGDTHFRKVCSSCGHINYENPKVVVGSVCTFENKFLMCKRAIDPQKGLWTLPAGYLENNESVEEGAIREAYEEAYAKIRINNLLAVYSLKHVEQVQILFHSELIDLNIKPGIESLEVGLLAAPSDGNKVARLRGASEQCGGWGGWATRLQRAGPT